MYETEIAALEQEKGRLEAMLEVQQWAEEHKDMLRGMGLYESLIRLTVPK